MYIQTNLLDISKTMLIAIPLWYIYTTIRKKRFKIRREIFVNHFNDIVTYYDLVQDVIIRENDTPSICRVTDQLKTSQCRKTETRLIVT